MFMVMDMSTGKTVEDEFGNFESEVMNAEWPAPQPALQLGLQTVESHRDAKVAEAEAEAFLRRLYDNI